MSRILSRRGFQDMVFGIVILLMLSALVMHTEQSVSAAREGVSLCINVILPSLFPFFVVSTLAVELGLIDSLGSLGDAMDSLYGMIENTEKRYAD